MIYVIVLPLILGYIIGLTLYLKDRFNTLLWSIDSSVVWCFYVVKTRISRLFMAIKKWHYRKFVLPVLIKKTRAGDDEALNERLKNALPKTRASAWWEFERGE